MINNKGYYSNIVILNLYTLIFRAEMDYKLTLKSQMNKLLVVSQLYMSVEVVNQLLINYHLNVVSVICNII